VSDYSHLQKLDVTDANEAEYTFGDIIVGRNDDGSAVYPSIFFRPMIESNKVFLHERIRMATERAEAVTKSKKKDKVTQLADRMDDDRDTDRVLIARTCAVRWGTAPKDAKGKEHPFSAEECLAFLQALPNYIFEPLRSWVQNPYNFVDSEAYETGGGIIVKADALGNSSRSGSGGSSD
jgi:hypothetical protein